MHAAFICETVAAQEAASKVDRLSWHWTLEACEDYATHALLSRGLPKKGFVKWQMQFTMADALSLEMQTCSR